MKRCPRCGSNTEVIDSRSRHQGQTTQRRRQCLKKTCGYRVTTVEHEVVKTTAYVPKRFISQ